MHTTLTCRRMWRTVSASETVRTGVLRGWRPVHETWRGDAGSVECGGLPCQRLQLCVPTHSASYRKRMLPAASQAGKDRKQF